MKRFLAWCRAVPESFASQPPKGQQSLVAHSDCRLCHVQSLAVSADARCLRHRLGRHLP